MTFDELFAGLPLIAILRGIEPGEAVAVAETLHAEGFAALEVTLNSPAPLESISAVRARFEGRLLVGVGTVLSSGDVRRAASAGAQFIVSPDANPEVIRATKRAGLASLPGVFTPTEAFAALAAGADALKLFPAEASSPAALEALLAVLPSGTKVLPVGGIEPVAMAPWRAAGAAGFGVGGALYRAGRTPSEIRARAQAFVGAWR